MGKISSKFAIGRGAAKILARFAIPLEKFKENSLNLYMFLVSLRATKKVKRLNIKLPEVVYNSTKIFSKSVSPLRRAIKILERSAMASKKIKEDFRIKISHG